jgi:hypothetical protein
MGWIVRGFSGDEDLWKIIWIYAVLVIFLAYVANVVFRLAFGIDFDNPTPTQAIVLDGLKIIYGIWFFVAAWRCSNNTETAFWSYLVRALLIGYILLNGYVYYQYQNVLDPFLAINKSVDFIRAMDAHTK